MLHLSPASEEPTGLAAYAVALRRAAMTCPQLEIVPGEELGTSRIPLRGVRLLPRVRQLVDDWAASGALTGFDVVHLEIGGGSYREYHLGGELTRRRCGPPRVITLHDPPFTVGRTYLERIPGRGLSVRGIRRFWEVTVGWWEERRILHESRAVITLSTGGASALRRRFPGLRVPVSVLEHIAFPETGSPAAARPAAEVGLLWLGFHVPGTGVGSLLWALSDLARAGGNHLPPWHLRIAGGVPPWVGSRHASDLKGMIDRLELGDRVEDLGFVSEAELGRLMSASQVLVLPRERRGRLRHELQSVSGSMIRAMAAGLAVITTDARAAAEEIVSGKNGLLVAAGDSKGLAEALSSVIADAGFRARLGLAAQEHIRRAHSPEKITADHLTVYLAAAGARRSANEGGERRPSA